MTAVSDDRTNSVIVTAPTEMMKEIENVITKLDTNPASEETLFIYRLKNGEAGNLEFVLNTLFGNIAQPGQQGGPNQQDPNQQNDQQYNNRNNNNGASSARPQPRPQPRLAATAATTTARAGRSSRATSQRAVTELTGKVFVVADLDTNALLVTTATSTSSRSATSSTSSTGPCPQVLIKVLVAEVTHNDDIDYGVDFSVLNRRPSGLGQAVGTNFGRAAHRRRARRLRARVRRHRHPPRAADPGQARRALPPVHPRQRQPARQHPGRPGDPAHPQHRASRTTASRSTSTSTRTSASCWTSRPTSTPTARSSSTCSPRSPTSPTPASPSPPASSSPCSTSAPPRAASRSTTARPSSSAA